MHRLARPTAWPSAAPDNVAWQAGLWLGQPSTTAICYQLLAGETAQPSSRSPRNSKSRDFLCLLKTHDFGRYFNKSKSQQAVSVNQHLLSVSELKVDLRIEEGITPSPKQEQKPRHEEHSWVAWEESFPGAGNTLCKGTVGVIIYVHEYKIVDTCRALSSNLGPVPLSNAESKFLPRPPKSQPAFPR